MEPKVRIYHPDYGWGTAYLRCDAPLPNDPEAPGVLMVRWDNGGGCAGCWVDPCQNGVKIEGVAFIRDLPNRNVNPLRSPDWVCRRLGLRNPWEHASQRRDD